jgi:3-hydroxyisobutyrate dehydrogenase-like beta-hydroxyacid dehydrogenase
LRALAIENCIVVTLLAESAACAGRAGIAPEVLVEVLRKGGGHGAPSAIAT